VDIDKQPVEVASATGDPLPYNLVGHDLEDDLGRSVGLFCDYLLALGFGA
jgi:hypothetical protein